MRIGFLLTTFALTIFTCSRGDEEQAKKRVVASAPVRVDTGIEVPASLVAAPLTTCPFLDDAIFESERAFEIWPGRGSAKARLRIRDGVGKLARSDTVETVGFTCQDGRLLGDDRQYDAATDTLRLHGMTMHRIGRMPAPEVDVDGAIERAERITLMAIDFPLVATPAQVEAVFASVREARPDLLAVSGFNLRAVSEIVAKDADLAAHFGESGRRFPLGRTIYFTRLAHEPRRSVGPLELHINGGKLLVGIGAVDMIVTPRSVRSWQEGFREVRVRDGDDRLLFLHLDFGDGDPREDSIPSSWTDVWSELHPDAPGHTWDVERNAAARSVAKHSTSGRYDRVMLQSEHYKPVRIELIGGESPDFPHKLGHLVELEYVPSGGLFAAFAALGKAGGAGEADDDAAGCDAVAGRIFATVEANPRANIGSCDSPARRIASRTTAGRRRAVHSRATGGASTRRIGPSRRGTSRRPAR